MKRLSIILFFFIAINTLIIKSKTNKIKKSQKQEKFCSKNLHNFFRNLWKNEKERKLVPGLPEDKATANTKIGEMLGGLMSVKMPDTPSPVFVNQNPYYSY